MAKRRKLEAPSTDDLAKMEAEFAPETKRGPLAAPIAQVAAEAAAGHDARSGEERAAAARDKAEAERLRTAEAGGLVMREVPLDQIRRDALVRDRTVIDAEALEELKLSIMSNGMRLPIEIFETPDDPEFPFGLLSGYRRLMAVQALCDFFGDGKHSTIKAVVRDPDTMGGRFAAMIEENEIRAALSHYERGRIAVIAAQQGAYHNTEDAVEGLFPRASKAKRSKVRSFALIFEELGDLLDFPDLIKERDGLRIAGALRDGHETLLRHALEDGRATTPEEEASVLGAALAGVERKVNPAKGGRPRKAPPKSEINGFQLEADADDGGWFIRIKGRQVDQDFVEVAMQALGRLLDKPRR